MFKLGIYSRLDETQLRLDPSAKVYRISTAEPRAIHARVLNNKRRRQPVRHPTNRQAAVAVATLRIAHTNGVSVRRQLRSRWFIVPYCYLCVMKRRRHASHKHSTRSPTWKMPHSSNVNCHKHNHKLTLSYCYILADAQHTKLHGGEFKCEVI